MGLGSALEYARDMPGISSILLRDAEAASKLVKGIRTRQREVIEEAMREG